jgi:hypothetical protein
MFVDHVEILLARIHRPHRIVQYAVLGISLSASLRKFSSKNRHPSSTDEQLERIFNAFKMIHT